MQQSDDVHAVFGGVAVEPMQAILSGDNPSQTQGIEQAGHRLDRHARLLGDLFATGVDDAIFALSLVHPMVHESQQGVALTFRERALANCLTYATPECCLLAVFETRDRLIHRHFLSIVGGHCSERSRAAGPFH